MAPTKSSLSCSELKGDGQFTLEDPLGQVIWQAQSSAMGLLIQLCLIEGTFVLSN